MFGRDGHARLGNRWGSAFDGMETFGKSWPWLEGLGYRAPACSPTAAGAFRPPARRRLCSPRGRRRFLAARGEARATLRATTVDDRDGRHEPCCERPRPARARLGPRPRPEPVGRLRLRAARLDVRPDPRPLLPGTTLGPATVATVRVLLRRRQEGDARLGRRLDRDRRRRVEGRARPGHARPEAEARGAGQAAGAAAHLHVEAAARRRRQAVPRQDPRARATGRRSRWSTRSGSRRT